MCPRRRSTPVAAHYREQVTFTVGDVLDLPFVDDSFDFVACFEVLEHVDAERATDEIRRVLASGGHLAVSTPNREVYPEGNPFHVREFLRDEFAELLRPHFGSLRWAEQRTWVGSGVRTPTERVRLVDAQPFTAPETYFAVVAGDAPAPPLEDVVVPAVESSDMGTTRGPRCATPRTCSRTPWSWSARRSSTASRWPRNQGRPRRAPA